MAPATIPFGLLPRKDAPLFQARYYDSRRRKCEQGHVGHIGKLTRLCGECLRAHWLLGGWSGPLPAATDSPVRPCKPLSRDESLEGHPDTTQDSEALRMAPMASEGQVVLICGSREWTDKLSIWEELASRNIEVVIHGAARGADTLAGDVARELGIPVQEFPADWDRYGKGAGYIRNSQMVKQAPDLVLAFGEGKGTEHTVKLAEKAGIPVVRVV